MDTMALGAISDHLLNLTEDVAALSKHLGK